MTKTELDELKLKLRGPQKTNPFRNSATKIFLIGSGKGGVGKSTITANLAVSLASSGHSVGLIDADIFGFSITNQLGIGAKPTRLDDMMLPPIAFGVKVISIGMFLEGNEPVSWRGPMLHKAIEQFLTDVYWGQLDYLLVDMPPGTGDVAISLGQLLPEAKSIVVTTPQRAASTVAVRSGLAAHKAGHEIIGVIENLSYLDTESGREYLFGKGGGEEVVSELSRAVGSQLSLLGQIPISPELSAASDAGMPIVLETQNPTSQSLSNIAKKLTEVKLSKEHRTIEVKLG